MASDLADQARDNLGRGKIAMAHQFALEGLKIDRENVTCYLIQALASHALGKHGEAASAIRLAFEGADDKEIRAAAVKIAIEGQPPDLALAWHYDPDNAEITARYLKQLTDHRKPDWIKAFEVAPDDYAICAEYSLCLLRSLVAVPSLDRQSIGTLITAFRSAPFLNGSAHSSPVNWRGVAMGLGDTLGYGSFYGAFRGAAADSQKYDPHEHEKQFVALFASWFDRIRSSKNGPELERALDRLAAVDELPNHVGCQLESMKNAAYSSLQLDPLIIAVCGMLLIFLMAGAILAGFTQHFTQLYWAVVWIPCLLASLIATAAAARFCLPASIGSRRRAMC